MKDTMAKESKNGRVPSPNINTSISGGNQETKKKEKKSVEADLEGAVKKPHVECSDEKERKKKKKKKTTSKHLIDADDGSAAEEKETLTKKKPVKPEDCTATQEATERNFKKKRLKNQLEDVKEVEQDEQSGDRKRNKKDKKRKYEASFVTEGSGENFTEVMQKKKGDEEAHEASDEIGVTKKKKKAKAAFAEPVETDALEGDLCGGDKVTQVKKVKKPKKGETLNLEEVEMEDEKIKKKKKAKSKKNETVEEEVVPEKKVKKEKSKMASVEVTEVEAEVAVKRKRKKKKKDGELNRAEKEEPTVDCEEEQSEETDTVRKKKKKKATKNPEEGAEQKECDTGAKKSKKNQEQKPSQVDVVLLSAKCGATDEVTINQERRQALQNDIDQWSQAAASTKPQGLGQWSTAQFDSTDQQQKFLRLMGGFKKGSQPACRSPGKANMALGKDAQQQLQQGLLGQFEQAHSRRIDFGSRGAGLGFTAPSNKKFTIDVNASRSVRFDD